MRAVTKYMGVKYSLQPHGWRSKILYYFAAFVVAFGGALAVASPSEAAGPTSYPVTVCGNSTDWFVNGDEGTADTADDGQGDRRPLAVAEGLVFSPTDLIHHLVPGSDLVVTSSLQPGTFEASPKPDQDSFFSIEVADAPPGNAKYGTLRWNTKTSEWEVTTGGNFFHGTNPDQVLTDAGLSHHARTFGVGYTNSPPGTVTSIVSSISFGGQKYNLTCPVAPSTVPGPVVTVTKVVTVTVPETSSGPTEIPSLSQSPSPGTTTTTVPETMATPTFQPALAGNKNGGGSLVGLGVTVAGVLGAILAALGIAGIVRARRRQAQEAAEDAEYADAPSGRHAVDNSQTRMIPVVRDYDMSDYGPDAEYDPALGGHAGESFRQAPTEEIPPTE